MYLKTSLLIATFATLSTLTAAAPVLCDAHSTSTAAATSYPTSTAVSAPVTGPLTADIITAIAPNSASCASAAFADECRTAAQAAPHINDSFNKYGITSTAEQAAVLSIMLYESSSFQYNKNHYPEPGRPGQGTRNMQSPALNLEYAQSLLAADKVAQANQAGPAAVLELVSGDDYSFGSAAWFLTTQCTMNVRSELQTGSKAGWSAYLTQCVGTTDTEDRDTIWVAATRQWA
jgi:hypothetical protein